MSCYYSYSISSGRSVKNFGSSSVILPGKQCSSGTASCHWGGGMVYCGLGFFSSRSLDGKARSRPRKAVGKCPQRHGYGFGAAGMGFCYRATNFGCWVGGVSRPCTITPITINEQLLQPLSLDFDPNTQMVKQQEKEQLKTLNNKFVCFIDKVRLLEQQNKVLETKWSFLQLQNPCKNTITPVLEAYIDNLKKQLKALKCNRTQLETDLKASEQILETNKKMYKDECSQWMYTKSEFCALKKDVDWFSLNKVKLKAKVGSLKEEMEFLRMLYKEEIHHLQAQISDTLLVVQMDNSRNLKLDGTIVEVKAQYEDIARRSRAEARAWCESKLEELRVTAGRNANSLRETKTEIAELAQMVQKRNGEVRSAKEQCCKLGAAVADAEQRGKTTVKDEKDKLSKLEAALQQSKADLTQQLHECQDLMNFKLALDFEMVTYRKLLEGEERRLHGEGGFPVNNYTCHLQRGLTYGPEPGFGGAQASVTGKACWASSMEACSTTASCINGVRSESTSSSHGKVVSVSKSARNNM